MDHAYTGREFGDADIRAALKAVDGIVTERLTDGELFQRTARAIARGRNRRLVSGEDGMGATALGNRSIVAHPGLPTMKDTLNSRIKHREWFRPLRHPFCWNGLGTTSKKRMPRRS